MPLDIDDPIPAAQLLAGLTDAAVVVDELLVWPSGVRIAAAEAQAIALQKADALGRLSGGISHDVVNRLGAVLSLLDLLATDARLPDDVQETAWMLPGELERGLRIMRGLLEVARHRPPAIKAVLVAPLVRETLEISASAMLNVDVAVTLPDGLPEVDTDESRLRQAMLAVTLSAIEAMGGEWTKEGAGAAGRLRVSARVVEAGTAGHVELAFEDSGPVVPEGERDGLFTAGREAGGGRPGRDLAVAHALITGCRGRLAYEPLPDGNRFVIELPLTGTGPAWEEASAPIATPVPAAVTGTPTVLVCDDDPAVRDLVMRLVQRAGYRAVAASGGLEAIDRIDAGGIDLVIADQRMAAMTGVELFRLTVERRPMLRARFILMSGDAGSADLVEFAHREGVRVIEKPFDFRLVTDTLRRLLGG